MVRMPQLNARIEEIAREVALCEQDCAGIVCKRTEGVPPRGLKLEPGRPRGRGCVIVGYNPGRWKETEKGSFLKAIDRGDDPYTAQLSCWPEEHLYYRRLRILARGLRFTGPILWTELAKCESRVPENGEKKGDLPMQTLRTCVNRFLLRELELVPEDWPLIGVGLESFRVLAYLCPDRLVIGVPHASNARGSAFTGMLTRNNTVLRPEVRKRYQAQLEGNPKGAIRLRAPEAERNEAALQVATEEACDGVG